MAQESDDSIADALRGLSDDQPPRPPGQDDPPAQQADAVEFVEAQADTEADAEVEAEADPDLQAEGDDEAIEAVDVTLEGEVDDESGHPVAAAPEDAFFTAGSAAPRSGRRTTTTYRRRSDSGSLKGLAAPVLITVGVLVLIPAVWATLLLSGMITSDRPNARTMALLMLVCWPIGLLLIAAGGWFVSQVLRAKRTAAGS